MADITKILSVSPAAPASGPVPPLNLPANGQSIEARVAQILSNGLVQLSSALGNVELQTSGGQLREGATVRLNVAQNGAVTITLPQAAQTPQSSQSPQTAQTSQALQNAALQSAVVQNTAGTAQPVVTLPANPVPAAASPALLPTTQTLTQTPVVVQSLSAGLVAAQQDVPDGAPLLQTATLQAVNQQQASPAVPASLSTVLHDALSRQTSLAPLVANLDYVARHLRRGVPDQLRDAVDAVIKTLIPVANVSADSLENALHRSGVFQEATLAQLAQKSAAGSGAAGLGVLADTPELQLDLKNALLKLDAVLQSLPREQSAALPRPQALLHAPRQGEFVEAQTSQQPLLNSRSAPTDIVSILTQQTEAALSRLRVLQFASMPAPGGDADPQIRPAQSLHVDLPLMLPNQTAVIPLQIERDAERRDAKKHERRWRVRFAFNLSELGSIHALLAFGAGLVHVTLWAENASTYQMFKAGASELRDALDGDELEIGGLEFRSGTPHDSTPPAGSYLDTRT